MAKDQEQTNEDRKWPWDWRNESSPKPTFVKKIVENLPSYARDVYNYAYGIYTSGLPRSYKLYNGFGLYCKVVRKHLQQQYKKVPFSLKQKAYQICAELFELIESLKKAAWPQPYREITSEPPPSPDFFADRWDTLLQELYMCVSSGEQQKKSEERKGILIRLLKIIGAIVVAVIAAIVVDIFGDFGWLQSIKEFIYNILWRK